MNVKAEQIGEPLPNYTRGEDAWPPAWKLPSGDDFADHGDLFDKMAWAADDFLLRQAIHLWDNCLRAAPCLPGIQGGMISAHARLLVGSGRCNPDLEKAADAVREAWIGMARQAQQLQRNGYDA